MQWWVWGGLALAFYLMANGGAWLALQVFQWHLGKKFSHLLESRQLERLIALEQEQSIFWPPRPRPGRYREIDQAALALLARWRMVITEANDLWSLVADFSGESPGPLRILAFGAWRPLFKAWQVWRRMDRLMRVLQEGERYAEALMKRRAEVEGIPLRVESEIRECLAKGQMLRASWESESEVGTQGLDALGQTLTWLDQALGEALERLRMPESPNKVATVLEVDEQLIQVREALQKVEKELGELAAARSKAEEILAQAEARCEHLQRWWEALVSKGARETSLGQALEDLCTTLQRMRETKAQATLTAFAEVAARGEEFLLSLAALEAQFEAFDALIKRADAALSESAAKIASAAQTCEELQKTNDLRLDLSLSLLEEAQEIYKQARQHQALGTWHGYPLAASLAEQAGQKALLAAEEGASAAKSVAQIWAEQPKGIPEVRSALRERAQTVEAALRYYVRHWDPIREQTLAEAHALLDKAESQWSRLPEAIQKGEGTLWQSALAAAQETLEGVIEAIEQSRQRIEALEEYLARINSQRTALEQGLSEMEQTLLPSLLDVYKTMLPELAERFDAWRANLEARTPSFQDPSQIDYQEAAERWLPGMLAEGRDLLTSYREDVARYQRLYQEASRSLERAWQRLQRLDPFEAPFPEEDLEQLTADFQAWQAEGEASMENPAALDDLVGRRAADLERRIEAARQQIIKGRQTLNSLDKQFEQRLQAIQRSRGIIRALQQDSQWRNIAWPLGEGESLIERAMAFQESSQGARTFAEAINQMQEALNALQEALQTYQAMEQQLRNAQERLNREFRAAAVRLERAQRRAAQLRQEGPSDALRSLDERCMTAMNLISLAQRASTFEEALLHLHEAQEALARV